MYQVLARKYRPKNFHELLGQDHVAKALTNAINQARLHHAYLFTGTRGVGKTTIARILAKCLNCETGVTSEPCGVCSTCQAVDAGRFIDLIEIDAASRTKVEDTRELLDNVPYAPTQGRYKVYLIDEVHMLSTHSFNALLKTLEEPPAHVKFLLATTDPQKLPITIVSRCLQFVLRPLPQTMLAEYLGQILTKEHIGFERDALWQLASSAKGSVRDALSLTDQAIAFGSGQISDTTLRQMLGLIDQTDVIGLLGFIYQQRLPELREAMQQLRGQVVDAKAVFDSLADVLHQVALLQLIPDFDLQINRQQAENLQQLAQSLPAELVQLYYEIVVQSRERIALANTPLQALEMCLLRLLAFKPLPPNQLPGIEKVTVNTKPTEALEQQTHLLEDSTPDTRSNIIIESATQGVMQSRDEASKDVSEPELSKKNSDFTVPSSTLHSNAQFETPILNEDSPNSQSALVEIKDVLSSDIQAGQVGETDEAVTTATENRDIADTSKVNSTFTQAKITQHQELPTDLHASLAVKEQGIIEPQNNHDGATYPLDTQKKTPVNPEENQITDTRAKQPNCEASNISPAELLQPLPQSVIGEWTPEKWDYWVYQAREQGWLDEDELVLAKRGMMIGAIDGQSDFITADMILGKSATFDNMCTKIKQQLVGIQITPKFQNIDENLLIKIPEKLQENRENLAIKMATHQIEDAPVMQSLFQQHASLNSVKLIK